MTENLALVVVETETECPQCRTLVSVLTDGTVAVVQCGPYAPQWVRREDGETEIVVSCGAPYAGDVCGETTRVPLDEADYWLPARARDRDQLTRFGKPVRA